MDAKWIEAVLPFVVGLIGGFGSLWLAANQGRKNRYDAVDQANEALMKFITPLQGHVEAQDARLRVQEEETRSLRERVRVLESRLAAKEELVNRLLAGVSLLSHQVVALGHHPVWSVDPSEFTD